MKAIFLFAVLFFTNNVTAQINWYNNFNSAKKACKESGKLMVIDFWADWCKPCKTMEEQLWNNTEIQKLSSNFVALKIDVDKDKLTPEKFLVTGIPKVVIAMADGTVLWERMGFSGANEFLEVLSSVPDDVSKLYQCFYDINALGKDSEIAFKIAIEFQQLARKNTNNDLRSIFIARDVEYFKKSLKYNTAPEITCDIELYMILNDVYEENPDRALKKFSKIYGSPEKCKNQELAHFVLANCFKKKNDDENFNKEMTFITSTHFLTQLN